MTRALSSALLHFLWQGALGAFLLWIALVCLRKRPASVRYIVSCMALAVLTVVPVITAGLLYSPARVTRTAFATPIAPILAPPVSAINTPGWLALTQAWALPVWSCGVLLFSVRLMWGCREVSLLKRSGQPAEPALLATVLKLGQRMGLKRPVRLLISSLMEGPSVVGWIRPVILMPAATVLGLTTEQLEAVLAHELAHIRRFDYAINLGQMVVETLFFYHPAVWWISKRIRTERELCCDDMAVRCCGDAVSYARALTTLERLRVLRPNLALGSTDGPLMYRIQRLLGVARQEQAPSRVAGAVAVCLAVACFAATLDWARAQAPQPAPSVPDQPGVRVDLSGSSVIHRTPVPYPATARTKGIQGKVTLELTMDASGNVSDARVLSGPEELRKAALQSVLNWHFTHDAAGTSRQVSIDFDKPPAEEKLAAVAVNDVQTEKVERERKMQDLKSRLEDLQARRLEELTDRHPLKAEAAAMAAQLQTLRAALSVRGRILKNIDVSGLSEPLLSDLLSRLPIRAGDVLSEDSVMAARIAIHDFDEHLEVGVSITGDGQVEIRITVPGSRR